MKRITDRATWSSPNPTAPVIESRVPVFAPILRVSHNSRSREGRYETPWGWVELEGPVLTQEHRAILDMAMAMAVEKKVFQETGGMAVRFDAWEVKKALGYEGGSGHKRFIERMREMRRAELRVHSNKTGKTRESGILDSHTYDENNTTDLKKNREWMCGYEPQKKEDAKKTKEKINNMMEGSLRFYEIRLSPNFMQFFKEEMRVHYDPLVPGIVQIPDGTIRAIILFFLTHEEECRYSIKKVMEIVGAIEEGMTKGTISKIMAKPEKFKEELEDFGIFVEGKNLRYERHPKVFFTSPPLPASTGAVIDAEQVLEPDSSKTALEATPEAMVSPEAPAK